MSSAKELPEIINKTADELNAIIEAVINCNLMNEDKAFVLSAINLSVWLPTALLGHQITVSNLRKLVFGGGSNTQKSVKGKAAADKEPSECTEESELESMECSGLIQLDQNRISILKSIGSILKKRS